MNRQEALQWCVENVTSWEKREVLRSHCEGEASWIFFFNGTRFLLCNVCKDPEPPINKSDWIKAKKNKEKAAMNKELMMKAAVQFKGVWPDEEETHLYKFQYGRFVTGMDGGAVDLVCTREQFEIFVESLFEGAPDYATHVDSENLSDFYKYDGYAYFFIGKQHSVRCAKFDKLIPRPVKKADPEALYMPKVGEECGIFLNYEWHKISVMFVGRKHIIFELDGVERVKYYNHPEIFRPLRTERELFIEQATKDYLDQVGSDAVNEKWFGRIFGAMFDKDCRKN